MSGVAEWSWPDPLVRLVLGLDPGGQARLRRGADSAVLLMVPGLATLLRDVDGDRLDDALLTARIAAILGRDGSDHPAAALARAKLDPRRMGRLLTSGPEVLPDRLVTVARFLAAKRDATPAAVAPFHRLMAEVRGGREARTRAQWARRFSEAAAQRDEEKA